MYVTAIDMNVLKSPELKAFLDQYEDKNLYIKVTTCQPWAYTLYANEESPYDPAYGNLWV